MAKSVWLPAERPETEAVAVPLLSGPLPKEVAPSMKVTVPVAPAGATVAVRVRAWPNVEAAGGARAVVVGVRPEGPTV